MMDNMHENSIFKSRDIKDSSDFITPFKTESKKSSVCEKPSSKFLGLHHNSISSIKKNAISMNKSFDKRISKSRVEHTKNRSQSQDKNSPLPFISPSTKPDHSVLSPSIHNEEVVAMLNNILTDESVHENDESRLVAKIGMNSWFKNTNPADFAKTQRTYVRQIDTYLK
uniref:Uncharacterized protein n=1 Tax=Euplotes harpa TaxID=151035 RepID=A0A7S3N931_9SPIT|mmetsp:Transcript_24839/g.28528  ORF Transcript_24839/g.28528 Transcript_24839/m.28528 type:complete len:169 (+) Transcript_24839:353-859(+)